MEDLLWIDGVAMPTPAIGGIKVSKNKIWSKNTGRSANGTMIGDIIAIKYKLDITWSTLSASQVAVIENEVSDKAFFSVKFTDPKTNTLVTKTMYAGDPVYPVHWKSKNGYLYQGVTVSLIEK